MKFFRPIDFLNNNFVLLDQIFHIIDPDVIFFDFFIM